MPDERDPVPAEVVARAKTAFAHRLSAEDRLLLRTYGIPEIAVRANPVLLPLFREIAELQRLAERMQDLVPSWPWRWPEWVRIRLAWGRKEREVAQLREASARWRQMQGAS